jgi:serine/threonine-protein kinase
MSQMAEALDHAANQNVVHRDIKPSNILCTADGRAKLVDMGLARAGQLETDTCDLTASGVTLGTFDYISPEQGHDPRDADVRSDLYSLGCTMYFVLTGQAPFPEGTPLQKLLKHAREMPIDPAKLRPDVPNELTSVLGKLLAKQPEDRYQRPSELLFALSRVAETLGLPTVSAPVLEIVSSSNVHIGNIRHLPWVVPSAALTVVWCLLAVASWKDRQSESELPGFPTHLLKPAATAPALPSNGRPRPSSNDSGNDLASAKLPAGPPPWIGW